MASNQPPSVPTKVHTPPFYQIFTLTVNIQSSYSLQGQGPDNPPPRLLQLGNPKPAHLHPPTSLYRNHDSCPYCQKLHSVKTIPWSVQIWKQKKIQNTDFKLKNVLTVFFSLFMLLYTVKCYTHFRFLISNQLCKFCKLNIRYQQTQCLLGGIVIHETYIFSL